MFIAKLIQVLHINSKRYTPKGYFKSISFLLYKNIFKKSTMYFLRHLQEVCSNYPQNL